MEVEKMSANEVRVLEYIYENHKDFPDQNEIGRNTNLEPWQVSRVVHSLEKKWYIKEKRIGKHKSWTPNKNKKQEALQLVRVYQNCKQEVENNEKSILRVHNIEYYFKIFIPFNYDKSLYEKRYPAHRRVALIRERPLFKSEIHLSRLNSYENSAQIFPNPFFIIVNLNISQEDLDDLVSSMCCKRLMAIEDILKNDGTLLGKQLNIDPGDISINDDWLSRLAINHGLYNKFIDNSPKNFVGENEYPYELAIKIIPATLSIRKFCGDNNLKEVQFGNMITWFYNTHGSPIPSYPFYAIGSAPSGCSIVVNAGSQFSGCYAGNNIGSVFTDGYVSINTGLVISEGSPIYTG